MKKIFLLAFVLLMGFIMLNRQRMYVRDPLAAVYRNEVKQSGVQVFINYSNDVLLWQDAEPDGYRVLVQGWNKLPGTPIVLRCMRWMACLADADRAATLPIAWTGKEHHDPKVTMTNREVSFVGGDGARMRVELH